MVSVAVLVMGVYLFMEVRSGAAAPDVAAAPVKPAASDEAPAAAAPAATAKPAGMLPKVGRVEPGTGGAAVPPPPPVAGDEAHDDVPSDGKPNPKLDAIMDQANKAYDRQDFDEAKAIAGKVLAKIPNNTRMLRIMVSSSCIDGDVAIAQKYFPSLPKFDREQMKARCDRYGVTLTDPPQ
jgi:hypothetical protein